MSTEYLKLKKVRDIPRLPLEGSIDLTYRCNNNCRHCWLKIPPSAEESKKELSLEEIKYIVDEARKLGCRRWSVSGGEPMLRSDFAEIFDYVTKNSISYSINTNGTLITPKIAQLLKREGSKMVALYGATPDVHDHITRNPNSFEATMRGFAYLKEAGAGFIVQLIPMKDNYHQFPDMVSLAESLSKHYRVGASWLYLSACGDTKINKEITHQRLPPEEVVELDKPDLSYEDWINKEEGHCYGNPAKNDYHFASCIATRRDFHIDPYGQMTFCCFINDPTLRYDLRKGSFEECWEKFIPSLSERVRFGREYLENCGSCELQNDCLWCPVYGYLEHRSFEAKVEYLCDVARESRRFKEEWKKNHCRYYQIADIAILVESDLPITDTTFHPKFKHFEVDGPSGDTISIRHHFSLPDLNGQKLGKEVYRKPPWAIYRKGDSWVYLGISPEAGDKDIHRIAVFNHNYTKGRIYNDKEETFLKGNLNSLTLFSTDQILLAKVLADRDGCYLHSSGVDLDGKGLLFVGHSDAGKSTIAKMLKDKAEILCDDRIIIRKQPEGFRIYGTWSHGEMPEVSNESAPLRAILFLNKTNENRLELLKDRSEINKMLLACLIKPFVTAEWWEKMLSLINKISVEIPCYLLYFDKSGGAVDLLKKLLTVTK